MYTDFLDLLSAMGDNLDLVYQYLLDFFGSAEAANKAIVTEDLNV